MKCDWCATCDGDSFVTFEGQGGGAMTLCGRCCDIAFPGMRDQMRCECPICQEQAAAWN